MMDVFVTDTRRALILWRRLRVSYYINSLLIILTATLVFSQPHATVDGAVAFYLLLALLLSHLNYHYHLAKVATLIGKTSNWWFVSFVTFPFGPLLSYHFIKPAAIRSGVPIGTPITEAWLYRAVTESGNPVEFRKRFFERYGETSIDEADVDKIYAERSLAYARRRRSQTRTWSSRFRWLASHRRRVILAVAAALYLVSALFAPWTAKGSERVLRLLTEYGVSLHRLGPIVSPPDCAAISDRLPCRYELNVSVILVEWVLIAILAAIAWFWNKE